MVAPPLWLLVAMVGAGPFTIQMVVPLLPDFAKQFAAANAQAQMLLTLALVGIALGQLLYGPFADRFGRRPVVMLALWVFFAASLVAVAAPTLWALSGLRALQAVGACGGMVIGRAMVRDCFPRERAASVLGYVMMGMTVVPMASPYVASIAHAWFGWQSIFVLAAAIGLWLLIAVRRHLPETLAVPQALPGLAGLLALYAALLRTPAFRYYVATVALSSGIFFAFVGGAPHVVMTGMGLTPSDYSLAFLATSAFYGVGNFFAGRYSQRFGVVRMIGVGTLITFAGTALALTSVLLLPLSLVTLFLPIVLMTIGNGISQTNAVVAALSVRPQLAGTASGLTGFAQMGFGALVSWAVGLLETSSGVATTAMMLAGALATQLVLVVMRAKRIS